MTNQFFLWRAFLRTVSTGSLPFRLAVRARVSDGAPLLVVTLNVKDIHDGHDTQAGVSEALPPFPGTNGVELHPDICARRAEEIVYAVVERVWLHELREHWTVGRSRVRDPHVGCGDGVGTK